MLQAQLAQGSSSFGQGLELTMAPMGWEFLLQPPWAPLGRNAGAGPTHFDDVQQLSPVDAAIAIHVVELEIPPELLVHLPLQHQAQSCHILHEIDVAILKTEG